MKDNLTFTQFFDGLVAEKKQQVHKSSDEEAFYAAQEHCIGKFGFIPDTGFEAYRKRKNAQIKGKSYQKQG